MKLIQPSEYAYYFNIHNNWRILTGIKPSLSGFLDFCDLMNIKLSDFGVIKQVQSKEYFLWIANYEIKYVEQYLEIISAKSN